jgi:hypothetical protein
MGTDRHPRVYNRRVDDALVDEAQTIARSAAGDSGAFGVLVGRYQEVAFRAAYLIVRDAGAAEDVAQEAFIRVRVRAGLWLGLRSLWRAAFGRLHDNHRSTIRADSQ